MGEKFKIKYMVVAYQIGRATEREGEGGCCECFCVTADGKTLNARRARTGLLWKGWLGRVYIYSWWERVLCDIEESLK